MRQTQTIKRAGWILCAALPMSAIAAQQTTAVPPQRDVPLITLPALDVSKALAEDIDDKRLGVPRRFGLVADVKGGSLAAGEWSQLGNGDWQWQVNLSAPGAKALGFGFRAFQLPYGATLDIHSADKSAAIGPFTDRDNRPYGELFTPLLAGDAATLTLRVPAQSKALVKLELGSVNRAYRGAFAELPGDAVAAKSGSCNVDSICSQGDPWRPQIASVAHYSFQSQGSGFVCTGQLTADASRADNRLLTTANHCIGTDTEARSMVFYWGYENASCRTPGSAASGVRIPLSGNFRATQSGARLLGTHVASDFTLVRLDVDVPSTAQAVATGWDRRENVPTRTFTVHHPQGHEKRISFDDDSPLLQNGAVGGITGTRYWHILAWNLGTTEGGSSGSGLWNQDGRLIGALSGGEASCSNNVNDYYGRLSTAWEGDGTAATRVRDGLDPFSTGAQFVDGAGVALGSVTLTSTGFNSAPQAGQVVVFEAAASGGTAPYTYQWDLDGDGEIDRTSSVARIDATFPRAGLVQVTVRASDSGGRSGMDSRSLTVRGPRILAEAAGTPTQVCGNDNAQIDPGETWQQPIRLTNSGDGAQAAGHALFAAATGSGLSIGPSSSGYTGTTSASGGCGVSWIDLIAGANATPALTTAVAPGNNSFGPLDDARTAVIALGGTGFRVFGTAQAQAVMSTNGYLSFNSAEQGGDFSPTCTADFSQGASGPQLRPFHDDLLVPGSGDVPIAGAGLRYRYFASCPRAAEAGGAQGCHVFSWTRMQRYNANQPAGDFDFQAVAYESSGQIAYQYRNASPNAGAAATIGIVNSTGSEVLNVSCQSGSPAPANSAACLFAAGAQPTLGSAAIMPSAAQNLPALSVGQSATVNVAFSSTSDAQCGASLAFEYVGSADSHSHSFERRRVFDGSVAASCQPTSCVSIGTPPPNPARSFRPGLYFNPQRPGNGVINFVYRPSPNSDNGTFGGAWYTALRDRTPIWYSLQGGLKGTGGMVPITRFRNTAAPNGFVTASELAGSAWVAQIDREAMLFAWQLASGDTGIERLAATPLPFGNPNHTQTWFNASEPGWGLAIESLNAGGPFEFVGAFVYDASGAPRWAVGDITSSTGGTVPLIGHRPHCPGCPWITNWTADGQSAGSLQLGYGSRSSGTLSTSISLPGPYVGSWNRNAVPIIPIVEPVP